MNKYSKNQTLITERPVAISVHEMNGKELNEVIEYPKGETVEILEVLANKNYKLEFWTDSNETFNDQPVTYEMDESTIDEWLKKEEEE